MNLYVYAKRLKGNYLPKNPVRVFILSHKWRDFTRLRLMYYLLPHNIYNYGRYPNPKLIKNGDYVLVLSPSKGISYSERDNLIHYGEHGTLKATLVDEALQGTLYKIKL